MQGCFEPVFHFVASFVHVLNMTLFLPWNAKFSVNKPLSAFCSKYSQKVSYVFGTEPSCKTLWGFSCENTQQGIAANGILRFKQESNRGSVAWSGWRPTTKLVDVLKSGCNWKNSKLNSLFIVLYNSWSSFPHFFSLFRWYFFRKNAFSCLGSITTHLRSYLTDNSKARSPRPPAISVKSGLLIFQQISWVHLFNLFVTSKNEATNSPMHEFKVLQNVFKNEGLKCFLQ